MTGSVGSVEDIDMMNLPSNTTNQETDHKEPYPPINRERPEYPLAQAGGHHVSGSLLILLMMKFCQIEYRKECENKEHGIEKNKTRDTQPANI